MQIDLPPFALETLGFGADAEHAKAVERARFTIFWCIANGMAPAEYRINDAGLLQLADMQARMPPPTAEEIANCKQSLQEVLDDGTV
jgi:hypothetical protein